MEQIFAIVILSAIIISFIKFKYGIAIYVAYFFLVPYLQVNVGVSLSYNFVYLLLLAVFVFYHRILNHNKIDVSPILPFIIYFACFFVMIPMQNGLPFFDQVNNLRIDFLSVVILPLIMWNVMKVDKNSVFLFENILLFCITVACIYGVFLTQMPGINPYIFLVNGLIGVEDNEEWLMAEDGGRLFGRISSVFLHPMNYAIFLGMSFILLLSLWGRKNKLVVATVFLLVLLNMVICGVRSVIVGIGITYIYYIVKGKHYRLAFYSFLLGLIVILTIGVSTGFSDYIGSIASSDSDGLKGASSLDLRLAQLEGSFVEIKDCFFQGKGYGWTGYYWATKGPHPTMLGFESLIFVILCNAGLLGFLIWWIFLKKMYDCVFKIAKDNPLFIECLILFFIVFCCITGLYNYMRYYVVFYIIMLGREYHVNEIKVNE